MSAPPRAAKAAVTDPEVLLLLERQKLQQKTPQRTRSLAIAWALAALATVFFAVTIVRVGSHGSRPPISAIGAGNEQR